MIQKTTRIALEVVAGLIAVAALLVGVAFWRLSSGPVGLDFLAPRIEAAFSDPPDGLTVKIGTTELTWGGWRRTVDLHARDVRIRDRDGALIAVLPDTVVRLSLRALVQGVVAPTLVELIGARVRMTRRADGGFQIGSAQGDDGQPTIGEADFTRVLPSLIDELMSPPAPGDPLSFLRAVRIVDGRVVVVDERLSQVWQAPRADIELRRDAAGLAGEVDLEIALADTRANVLAGFLYDRTSGYVDLTGDFTDLQPLAVVSVAPRLSALGGLSMPLSGSVSASFTLDGDVDALHFAVSGGAGQFALADLFPEPLPVRGVSLAVSVDGAQRRATIETASLSLGTEQAAGPQLAANGTVTGSAAGFGGDLDIELALSARAVAMAELAHYWPTVAAKGERRWILRNIPHGRLDDGEARAAVHVPAGQWSEAVLRRLDGTLRYSDVEVHFLRPLPPITGIAGTGKFDARTITFEPETGRLGALELEPGTVEIAGLDAPRQTMTIDAAAVGPLREVLGLLDHDRLRLIRGLGLDPGATAGQVASRLQFRFPLLDALTLEQIEIAARANMEQVSVGGFLMGRDATDGSLSLTVDKSGMQIVGPLKLGGVPLRIDWKEAFTAQAAQRRRLEIEAERIDESGRRVFGIDVAPYLLGPVSASILVTSDRSGRDTIKAAVNLQEAALAFAPLSWDKPAGVEGEAYLTLELADKRLTELNGLEIKAGSLRARGRGRFDATGQDLASMTLDELAFDASDLRDVTIDLYTEAVAVRVGGGVLDARPLFGEDDAADQSRAAKAEATTSQAEQAAYSPLHLSAHGLQAVYFGTDRYFEQVDLELARGHQGWERIEIFGRVPRSLWLPRREQAEATPDEGPRTFSMNFAPVEAGGMGLSIKAEDMGAVLRALNAFDTIKGGRLEITGQSDGPLPTRPLKGRIEARDYVVVDAPALARLLTVASLTGINDLLRGKGIRFQRLVGEFTLQGGKMETDLMRAYGPALGLTAKGGIDFDRSQADLEGTVVPAYTVNRILGEIPLLGPLLTGGEGEGFLAVTYKMTGKLSDPEVSVNALSALAPGFLRGLFSAGDGADGEGNIIRALPEWRER